MGCGVTKEKIEDEIMKAKQERTLVQMERINQMKLLEELGFPTFKKPFIPDYLVPVPDILENKKNKNICSFNFKKNKKKKPERS